jgi:hypothetical protein
MNTGSTRIAGTLSLAIGIAALLTPHLFEPPRVAAQNRSAWTPTIAAVRSPVVANAGEPQLTVSNRGVLLSWIEHAGAKMTLRFAERTATGWSQPRTVASGDDWSVNGLDVPSVLRLSNGTVVAQWLRTSGAGLHANDLRLSTSKDDGRTWSAAFAPYHDEAPRQRLFPSLFEMPNGGFGLIWLTGAGIGAAGAQMSDSNHARGADHGRQQGTEHQGHGSHQPHGAGADMGNMALRFAAFDGAWKQIADLPVDPRVCECCSTAAVVTTDGVVAAYRNRSDDEIRDIYVSRFAEGRWSDPAVVHPDTWRIPACPINGPALSAKGRNVAIAWYTVKDDQGHAYVAFSRDAGRRFSEPVRLDDKASLGRVDVELLDDGSALASWVEVGDNGSQFRARHIAVDGTRSLAATISAVGASRTSPRLASNGHELIFAWTDNTAGTSQVRTAVAALPGDSRR